MTEKEELQKIIDNINLKQLIKEYLIGQEIKDCFVKINFEKSGSNYLGTDLLSRFM